MLPELLNRLYSSSSDTRADLAIELRHKSSWKSDPCIGYASVRLDELLGMCTGSEGDAHSYPNHQYYVAYIRV